eukprot:1071924-Pyramimonas_sp.AAC.1
MLSSPDSPIADAGRHAGYAAAFFSRYRRCANELEILHHKCIADLLPCRLCVIRVYPRNWY